MYYKSKTRRARQKAINWRLKSNRIILGLTSIHNYFAGWTDEPARSFEEDPRILLFPQKWKWIARKLLFFNANAHRMYQRNGVADYLFINQAPGYIPPVPKTLSWRRRVVNPSDMPASSKELQGGHWVALDQLCGFAVDARDRWFYKVQVEKSLPFIPGEWLMLYREEMLLVFPSTSFTDKTLRETQQFLVNVVRDHSWKPIELRVYSLRFKPYFTLALKFKDPRKEPLPGENPWWEDAVYLSSHHRRYLEGMATFVKTNTNQKQYMTCRQLKEKLGALSETQLDQNITIQTGGINFVGVEAVVQIQEDDGIPKELWVYSSTYTPLFKTTLNFVDPQHPVHENRRGSWWHNNCFAWVFHEQYLREEEAERAAAAG